MPTFTPKEQYASEQELVDYFLSLLLEEKENKDLDISTRENYYKNCEPYITYLLSLVFSFKQETLNKILDQFNKLTPGEMIKLLKPEGPYNLLKPILDECEEEYDDELFHASTVQLWSIVLATSKIIAMFTEKSANASLYRLLHFHSVETIFALLYNY